MSCALCNVSNEHRHKDFILPMSRLLQDSSSDRSRPSGGGSSNHVTSPPPISLGKKVEVDLKEKQKRFEGLDKQAVEVIINSLCTLFWFPEVIFQSIKTSLDYEFARRNASPTHEFISSSSVQICASHVTIPDTAANNFSLTIFPSFLDQVYESFLARLLWVYY